MKISKLLLLVGSMGLISAAANAATPSKETQSASLALGASKVSEITFEEGKTTLTPQSREEIKAFIQEVGGADRIDEVKVAVWADREYPVAENKAPKADIKLAEKRADELKKYLKKDLKVDDVDTYNMTERPNALQKLMKTSTAKVKETMEGSGAAPKTEAEKGLFNQKAQASKAVLMLYMKK